jgi:hypothetical protein
MRDRASSTTTKNARFATAAGSAGNAAAAKRWINYQIMDDHSLSYLDLTLARDGFRRVLRFWSPGGVVFQTGDTSGMEILDIRDRQWEGLGVEVSSSEQGPALTLYARSVEDITLHQQVFDADR